MDERWYRASRLCRILGNPIAFQVVLLLERDGPLTPGEIAQLVKRKIPTVSNALAKLRVGDLVR